MKQHTRQIIEKAYEGFNKRNIDEVISLMHPDVKWPNGWEGGYVKGHAEVRDYWQRQWKEINPHVEPISIQEREDGLIEVQVHQVIKDMEGKLLFDGSVMHVYTFKNNLIKNMKIEDVL